MFQQTPALFQLKPYVGLFEPFDKVPVNSYLKHDPHNICNLCLAHRDPPLTWLMVILSASFY